MRARVGWAVLCLMLPAVCASGAGARWDEVAGKVAAHYRVDGPVSGEMEVGIVFMGGVMKVPVKYWAAGGKFRMEASVTQPGLPRPIETVVVGDGSKIWQYQKTVGIVTVTDLERVRPELRGSMDPRPGAFAAPLLSSGTWSERVRDGRTWYLMETGKIPAPAPISTPQVFSKALFWVDPVEFLIKRIEFFAEGADAGMWIEMGRIAPGPVDAARFVPDFPAGAQAIDVTEAVNALAGGTPPAADRPAGAR